MISHINERGNSLYISVAVIKNIVSGKKNWIIRRWWQLRQIIWSWEKKNT